MTQQHEPLIVARDRFGLAVVEELGAPPGAVLVLSSRLHPAHLPFGDPIVVAHAGHDPELRSTIDAVAFERGVPSVGVELLPTRIVCGPVVVPGRTACYGCAERRLLQLVLVEALPDRSGHISRYEGKARVSEYVANLAWTQADAP